MNATVAIVRCETYRANLVEASVRRGIDLLGGISVFAEKGERILLKPNALWATDPVKCVVSHPEVFGAVARLFIDHGAIVTYGDSPAGIGQSLATLKRCGFMDAVKDLPAVAADFDHGTSVSYPAGVSSKALFIANGVLEADGVISLPKLKTHGLTTMTCAIKNQFGCVPGLVKGEYHARYPDVYDFSRLLADITGFVRPRLYIADAIWAMEGNGPQSGDPKPLKCLLLSSDPVALDTVACRLMDCPPEFVPTIEAGAAAGLGVGAINEIHLAGDPLDDFIDRAFKIKRMRPLHLPANAFLLGLRRHFTRRPVIDASRCSRCGRCIQMCPVDPKAVQWRDDIKNNEHRDPPRYDYRHCIRCFCCHEMCPSQAITIKHPLLHRLFPLAAYLGLVAAKLNTRLRNRGCA
jgi:uncharacterized protein (DUF362 family)/Pyruvate/2-oxoacid:ferredoxin oxidoreductase delta subunit